MKITTPQKTKLNQSEIDELNFILQTQQKIIGDGKN